MEAFAEFEQQVREALAHLYDPNYQPAELLCLALSCNQQDKFYAVQKVLHRAIETLKPIQATPPGARSRRLYELLHYRYIQALTQDETAARLGITPRHLRREQQEAVHALANLLWAQRPASPATEHLPTTQPVHVDDTDPALEFRSQVRAELAALQNSAPGVVADVAEVIQSVCKVGDVLATRHGVHLHIGLISPGAKVAIHPSALRQILVTAIEKLTQHMSMGEIQLSTQPVGREVELSVTATPFRSVSRLDSAFIQEILSVQGGFFTIEVDLDQLALRMRVPAARKALVLVVDDNHDLVHFYRRYVANTRYEILHAPDGQSVFDLAERHAPDVIVLDIMLPDADGWELLTRLQEHAATASIPVIVCSVVRREELALALHATLYLAKPVRRQQFIQALEQVLAPASSKTLPPPANNARIC
jgi:CheY-like chemotaxis protein